MKVCYIIDSAITNGGAPTSAHILAKEIAKKDVEVFFIMPECTNKAGRDYRIHYCEISSFKETFPLDFLHPFAFMKLTNELGKLIKSIDPDIIHAHMPRGARAISILNKLKKINSEIKLIYTDREYVIDLKRFYKFQYKKTIASNYDEIVCLSESAVPFWRDCMNPQQVRIIPNPGGWVYDAYSETEFQMAQNTYPELANGKVNIVMVGRMTWEKRWDFAKTIIDKLNEKYNDLVNFILVISSANAKTRCITEEFLSSFGNSKNIYSYQNLSAEELSLLYYISDIHLITSCRESFGRTAIEAMSRKTVVISTKAGAIVETIGNNNFLVNDDVTEIVFKIVEYIYDSEKRETAKSWFFNRYHSNYTTDKNVELHSEMYTEVTKTVNLM